MAELDFLSMEEIDSLFLDDNSTQQEVVEEEESAPDNGELEENNEEIESTVESEQEENDSTENSESVDGEEDDTKKEEGTDSTESDTSPKFFSSIAKALQDSTFSDFDADSVTDADSFEEAFQKLLKDRLDEQQKRISDALESGVASNTIKQFEGIIGELTNIREEDIAAETKQGENLRKNLIFRDLINKGYSQEEALEEVNDAIESGNDVKKASRALKANLNFYKNKYQETLDNAKAEQEREIQEAKEADKKLRDDMLTGKTLGDIEISKELRQKAYDAVAKYSCKDSEGNSCTEIQKYEEEHPQEFRKNLGILFALTDGFTNINKLIKGKVNKESKKAIKELQNVLNNTSRGTDGNLKFTSGVDDRESFFKNYSLDV